VPGGRGGSVVSLAGESVPEESVTAPSYPVPPDLPRGGATVITVELARRLREAGLEWTPAPGDRFVMADPAVRVGAGLDDVFVVSEMTVDVADTPTGPLIRFNGTTEWALDSVEQGAVLWLPREAQLRGRLGSAFRQLEAVPGGFVVVVAVGNGEQRHVDIDAECAYARALLAVLDA
jgi:hypothetical protein